MSENKNIETLGQRIRACRKEMGYSQETLAALLYLKKSTISKYEKDERDMPSSILAQMAKLLQVSPNYLLCGDNSNDVWLDEMMHILLHIKEPALRNIARLQMKALANSND